MEKQTLRRGVSSYLARRLLWLGVALAALAAMAAVGARRWGRRAGRPAALPEVPPGLTEAEASARWSEGQDNSVHAKPPRTWQQIWRENLFTIFNLNLVGLAFTQALLNQWLNALLSLGTIALNVGLKVGREVLVMRQLAEFKRSARPRATVVREGKTRSIDPNRVVPGDVLIVGPGDQFLVDGQTVGNGRLVVDASGVTGRRGRQTVRAGDLVYAGSFCLSGRGAYVAQKVGDQRLIVSRLADASAGANAPRAIELTPLERMVDRILRVLLAVVAVFALLLLAAFFRLDLGIPVERFNDAASVIFGIAPGSLFLMIIVTYSKGTSDLVKLGALVHRPRSVESLAEATMLCFAEAGILAGTRMEMEPIQDPDDPAALAESRLRHILGDYARSTSAPNLVTRILSNSFEGSLRTVREEAPFLAALGWSAIAFDEPDLPGVYVLGEPEVLEGHLAVGRERSEGKESRSPAAALRRLTSSLGRLRGRVGLARRGRPPSSDLIPSSGGAEGSSGAAAVSPYGLGSPSPSLATQADGGLESIGAPGSTGVEATDVAEREEVDGRRAPLFRRWAKRLGRIVRPGLKSAAEREWGRPDDPKIAAGQGAVFTLAYHPDRTPLYDDQGAVQMPTGLIALCELRYARRLRPETLDLVRGFSQAGVKIKVLTSDDPAPILTMLKQSVPGGEVGKPPLETDAVSGWDLEKIPRAEWARVTAENAIFGYITPNQGEALVRAWRENGESVAVLGDGITDLPALQQANLAIARQTGTQAALGVADIVMMGNSPGALLQVLYKGQAIVHGLLDILKLSLTQVVYLALLIAIIWIVSHGFPYVAAQGTAIGLLTVTIPSVGLSLWAEVGTVPRGRFGQTLTRFVAPAAVSMSLLGSLVYLYFLNQSGQVAYAQLAVTYTLIYAGLVLAVLVRPPWPVRRREGDGVRTREWRMVGLALALGIGTFFLPWFSLAQRFLRLDWLGQPADYGAVALGVAVWAVALSVVWRFFPHEVRRYGR